MDEIASAPAPQPQERAERKDANVIYIGKKSVMGYVLAVVTQFNGGTPDVYIKARGKAISRAVDVAEIVRNRFLPGVKVDNILIKTEELDSEDGSKTKVSVIEIRLLR
ncbi:TPA: DNA-binding protein Alba [Candidatus Micrarchaeota archaeon]|nr:DNA-binding protein Alba [Candidatus Micrarchaeota archaeon]HIH30682.1 DNA-binding protein Alba [Candidatus Micrarchaeota archaeon]